MLSVTKYCLFACLLVGNMFAQELPPIDVFYPDEYGGENQNWSVSQSADKYIYVANDKGLLEFNGAKWQLYPSPNNTIMRSVRVINDKIYTGCYMEFGFWESDNFGQLKYNSISQKLTKPLIEDEQFWNILDFDGWVLFQSLNRIYIYNVKEDNFKIIESESRITNMFNVDDTIYFQKLNDGIYKIERGAEEKVFQSNIINDKILINIFKKENYLLLQTQEHGFFVWKSDKLSKWNIPAAKTLKDLSVYSSIQLSDGGFVLGTISQGIINLSENGRIKYSISKRKGLSNNTVLSLFEDVDNNIWLGLDNGINCINMNSPYKIFNDDNGTIGTVYTSVAYEGNLYLGTNQGLFFKQLNSNNSFKFIEGTQGQVWNLIVIDDVLFCGHNIGTLIVKGDEFKIVEMSDGTWNISKVPNQKNLLIQGKYNGLNILEKVNDKWQLRNKIDGFKNASRFVEWYKDTEYFINHEYKGVFRVTLNSEFTSVTNVVKEVTAKNGIHSSLINYNGNLLYGNQEGVYRYNSEKEYFSKDSVFSTLYNSQNYISGKLIKDDVSNNLIGFNNSSINYFSPGKLSDIPNLERIPLPNTLRMSKTGYENISRIGDNKYLFGTSEGYILIDLNKFKTKKYEVSITSVSKEILNNPKVLVELVDDNVFETNENNIGFSFAVAEFDKYQEVEYQYQLKGIYDNWSNWSAKSNELFKNLSFGEYDFNVRARINGDETVNTASFRFTIARPWYLTKGMISLYILAALLFSFVVHSFYKRYYRRQREKLLEKAKNELELKKLENEQQLMSFKNEKLKDDIESKNRELALSTMSLIKKNEFLNTIKNELKDFQDNKDLKSVVKIIDKNINNTDDWKLFEEAFNNADKDFLKKIKQKHGSLTSNDLRLCAYLRLNLSSKEIAPLLNISPRSVEVKRYRLRKKMNLAHETSLTNYILEL